jgi:hypothetical protein
VSVTNTKRLIAIILGRLEMDVDECIAAYRELAAAVFSQKSSRIPLNIKGKIQERDPKSSGAEWGIRD